MPNRDILVLGASAGGVQALSQVVHGFPADLPAAVFVVLHIAAHGTSAMPNILSRVGPLPAVHPRDGETIDCGKIYVAPPDHHLIVERGRVRLSRGPSENSYRPAVDVLFRTAANSYGNRVVGAVLTGNLDDGTAGLAAIKKHGGVAVVQDPETADYPGMPASAMAFVDVDHVVPLDNIAALLAALAQETVEDHPPEDEESEDMKEELERGADREPGEVPSGFTCPECGGALWESQADQLIHFRCRTGHAYAPESLLASQFDSLEATLWAAVRALEENASLARRMERWMEGRGNTSGKSRYDRRAREAEGHAEALRRLLVEEHVKV
ncbi:MAG TPA: chemotaxis protein CheB [Thermoanaerobaculia bacterium]|nr:chemotaxis protein CheB [Thermoanaerobaculia bacterium]